MTNAEKNGVTSKDDDKPLDADVKMERHVDKVMESSKQQLGKVGLDRKIRNPRHPTNDGASTSDEGHSELDGALNSHAKASIATASPVAGSQRSEEQDVAEAVVAIEAADAAEAAAVATVIEAGTDNSGGDGTCSYIFTGGWVTGLVESASMSWLLKRAGGGLGRDQPYVTCPLTCRQSSCMVLWRLYCC